MFYYSHNRLLHSDVASVALSAAGLKPALHLSQSEGWIDRARAATQRLGRIRVTVALILVEQRDRESDDLRRVFAWLDQEGLPVAGPAEFVPSMDVLETAATVEIIADLPGLRADALRVVFTRNMLVVAGQKLPPACEYKDAAFHLAERSFGRFARVFRLAGAFDAGRASATFQAGELHVVIPRIEERRGGEIRIPITAG